VTAHAGNLSFMSDPRPDQPPSADLPACSGDAPAAPGSSPAPAPPGAPRPRARRWPLLHHPALYGALVLFLVACSFDRWLPIPKSARIGSRGAPRGTPALAGRLPSDPEAALLVVLPPIILGSGLLVGYIVLRSYNIRVFPRCDFPGASWTAWHLVRCAIVFLVLQRLVLAAWAWLERVRGVGAALARVPPMILQVVGTNILTAATCAFVLLLVAAGGEDPFRALGLREKRVLNRMGIGLVGYLMVFPLVMLAGLLVWLLGPAFGIERQEQHLITTARYLSPARFGALVVFAALVVPATEEFLFRGFLYTTLRRYMGPLEGICASALLFALPHVFDGPTVNLSVVPQLFVVGFLLAYLYERTGSLVAPITAHACHNLHMLAIIRLLQHG